MKLTQIPSLFLATLAAVSLPGQSSPSNTATPVNQQYSAIGRPAGQGSEPVSYQSVSQLNGLLAQLEATSKNAQTDLVNLKVEHWKTANSYKRQALANVESIQRNLQGALPTIIGQLRSSPEDLSGTFKLYRNLDALYDVLGSVVEGAGAFGSKDEMQALSNDLNAFENTRKQMAERIETLSAAKEAEIVRLRTDLKTAQAAIPVEPPKKIVIDDTEPAKKPAVKKKPAAKPVTTPAAQPPSGQTQTTTPPAAQQAPAKPQ
jgi:hypothetical protein